MGLQESRIVTGARRTTTALQNADHKAGEVARSTINVFGGIAKLGLAAIVLVPGVAYAAKVLDDPVKEVFNDATSALPGLPERTVTLRSPLATSESSEGATISHGDWICAEEVRDAGTITDFLGRMVIAEYGLGDYNDSAVYDQAISLLQTPEFSALNPHIDDINNPKMGEDIFFPNCELR